jgi:hypothetical protein
MERIVINSGLKDFVLIDRIDQVDSARITGWKRFENAPPHLGIESLAQLGAFHVRFLTGFERHAFLLSIKRCSVGAGYTLSGTYSLSGDLTARSLSAYSYELEAAVDEQTWIRGEFIFASVDYDGRLRKDILQAHYRKVFSCLKRDSSKSC